MSTSDFGQRPGYGGDRAQADRAARPDYPQPEYPQPDYGQGDYPQDHGRIEYADPGYGTDTDAIQPVQQHLASPRVGFDGPAWEVAEEDRPRRGNFGRVLVGLAGGSLVAVALGVYGSVHDPTGEALNLAGFSDGLHAKAWLASAAFALVIVQLLSALAMWGRLPGVRPGGPVSARLHRWSGRLAVLVSLPVAAHCLYALGFQSVDARVVAHSLLGCFFYGIFVCKMIVLTRDDQKPWVLPVIGGLVLSAVTGLWLTSSLWFFANVGVSL